MSAHASQAFSIAHCTDSEDLPTEARSGPASARKWLTNTGSLLPPMDRCGRCINYLERSDYVVEAASKVKLQLGRLASPIRLWHM